MPHSESPEPKSPQNADVHLEDVPLGDPALPNGDSQVSDGDVAMEDAGDAAALPVKKEVKEVKLDELFVDVDSDEEFPSSRPKDEPTSSSPEAPSSPLYEWPWTKNESMERLCANLGLET